jgi:hypothetical protein
VQGGQGPVHLVVDGGAIMVGKIGQGGIPEDTAIDKLHDIEHAADNTVVIAEHQHLRYRHFGVGQGAHDPVFPVHGVGGLKQLAGRLAPQHVATAGCVEQKGGVGLALGESLLGDGPLEALYVRFQVPRQALCI